MHRTILEFQKNLLYEDARAIGEKITQMYQNGDVDEVYLVYTEYISTIASEPKVMRLLPLDTESLGEM